MAVSRSEYDAHKRQIELLNARNEAFRTILVAILPLVLKAGPSRPEDVRRRCEFLRGTVACEIANRAEAASDERYRAHAERVNFEIADLLGSLASFHPLFRWAGDAEENSRDR